MWPIQRIQKYIYDQRRHQFKEFKRHYVLLNLKCLVFGVSDLLYLNV